MEPTKRAAMMAVAVVDLNPLVNQPLLLKFTLAEVSGEESSIVFPFFQIDGVGTGERQFAKFHERSLTELEVVKGDSGWQRARFPRVEFCSGHPFLARSSR
jgi:hypothetical protein